MKVHPSREEIQRHVNNQFCRDLLSLQTGITRFSASQKGIKHAAALCSQWCSRGSSRGLQFQAHITAWDGKEKKKKSVSENGNDPKATAPSLEESIPEINK